MGTDFPSGKTSNATLTFSISLDIALAQKILPFLASRARACSTVSSMPNLQLLFSYLVGLFLMLAIILSHFLSTCLTHKAGSWSIACAMAYSAVCTGWDSINLDSFSHKVELIRKWPCYPFDNQLAHLGVSNHPLLNHVGCTLILQ